MQTLVGTDTFQNTLNNITSFTIETTIKIFDHSHYIDFQNQLMVEKVAVAPICLLLFSIRPATTIHPFIIVSATQCYY